MLPKFTVHSKNDDFKEREPDTEEESSKSYTHDNGSELGVEECVAQTPKEKESSEVDIILVQEKQNN